MRYFCGAARGFDLLCADRVAAARQRGIPVQLIMAVPCADQTAKWRPFEREEHDRLCARADQVRVLSPAYHEGCMQARNEYMVDRSALCLCYLTRMRGGTLSTVIYAGAVHVPVLNLAISQDAEAYADRLLQKHVDELPF